MSAAVTEDEVRLRRRRRIRRILIVVIVAVIPRFFVELHRVDGTSMWPSFNPDGEGEWLLVLKSWVDRDPEIWDPVVVHDPDDADHTVLKRFCAGPESYPRIEDGDLHVLDPRTRQETFVPRSLKQLLESQVPLAQIGSLRFRQQSRNAEIVDTFQRNFVVPQEGRMALSEDGEHLLFEPDEEGQARARIPETDFMDDHRSSQGRMTAGSSVVRDIGLTIAFAEPEAWPIGLRLEFQHVVEDKGDHEDLIVERVEGGLQLTTLGRGDPPFVTTVPLNPDLCLRWLNVDDHRLLLVAPDGSEEGFELLSDMRRSLVPGSTRSFLNLRLQGGSVVLSRLDISRDLHYTPALDTGRPGQADPGTLPHGKNLLLGDNGPASRDSRQWRRDARLDWVGRPILVVWPWSRARFLD